MKTRKQKIMNAFDSRVGDYDRYADIQKNIARNLEAYLPNGASKILEIGCGTGFLTKIIERKYPNAVFDVTDISPKMVEHTRQKFPANSDMNFKVMDGENVTSDKKYDLIVSSMTFQWFENLQKTIDSLRGHLSDDGKIVFSVLHASSFKEWYRASEKTGVPVGLLKPAEGFLMQDIEEISKVYTNGIEFLKELKRIGANIPEENFKPNSRKDLLRLCQEFDRGNKEITWAISYSVIEKSAGNTCL